MGYVKLVKNRTYYKRYRTKMRRRRECKTDYRQRRHLVQQDKRKYNAPKWRFVVRISNADVTCQITEAKIIGDRVLCAAYSHELKRYGLNVGLTNYSACYCTGLLLARRLLRKLKLDQYYPGKRKLDGNMFISDVANARWKAGQKIYRPFKCFLDVGLARTTSGARVFGALKGAIDGGLDIPHSNSRFPGFTKGVEGAKDKYDASEHKEKIFGGHVAEYMTKLQEDEPEKYQKHFARYIAAGIGPENLAETYEKVHKAIRDNPAAAPKKKRNLDEMKMFPPRPKKLSNEERQQRRREKIEAMANAGKEEDVVPMNLDDDEES